MTQTFTRVPGEDGADSHKAAAPKKRTWRATDRSSTPSNRLIAVETFSKASQRDQRERRAEERRTLKAQRQAAKAQRLEEQGVTKRETAEVAPEETQAATKPTTRTKAKDSASQGAPRSAKG